MSSGPDLTSEDKKAVVTKIIAALEAQLDAHKRAARDAHAAATDPGSKAENKYDTRSLESSYLARGQALRVAETEEALREFGVLNALSQEGPPPSKVRTGTLVALGTPAGCDLYFLASVGGGLEIDHKGNEVLVITPASPMGAQLLGKTPGERFQLKIGSQSQPATVHQLL